jgi:hypothetical protein
MVKNSLNVSSPFHKVDFPKPQIDVQCLAAANRGIVQGTWIDATQEEEAMPEQIEAMLAQSSIALAEEFVIRDSKGFYSLDLRHVSLAEISLLANFLWAYGKLGAKLSKVAFTRIFLKMASDLCGLGSTLGNVFSAIS